MKVIRSEKDKRLAIHLSKSSKKKKINVYFNKTKSGKTKYITGKFYSKKCDATFDYRSSYELAYFHILEKDVDVLSYIYEPFEVPYRDSEGSVRNYRPDILVLFTNGSMQVSEIKPKAMLLDYDVQAKAKAARQYIADNYKDINITYKFITESCLFKDTTAYANFLKTIK